MEFTVHRRAVQLKQIMTPVLGGGLLEILAANSIMSQFGAMDASSNRTSKQTRVQVGSAYKYK